MFHNVTLQGFPPVLKRDDYSDPSSHTDLHMCCIGAPLRAAAADGADDLLVMTDNGTHPVQIHTRLPCIPHFLTHSHAHFRQKAFIQHALRKLKCICCKKKKKKMQHAPGTN